MNSQSVDVPLQFLVISFIFSTVLEHACCLVEVRRLEKVTEMQVQLSDVLIIL